MNNTGLTAHFQFELADVCNLMPCCCCLVTAAAADPICPCLCSLSLCPIVMHTVGRQIHAVQWSQFAVYLVVLEHVPQTGHTQAHTFTKCYRSATFDRHLLGAENC